MRPLERHVRIFVAATTLTLLAVAGLQGVHPGVATAATRTSLRFTGQGEPSHSLWTYARNWAPALVPGTDPNRQDDVTVTGPPPPGGGSHVRGVPAGTVIHSLTLQAGGALSGGDLTVTATVNWTGGQLVTPLTLPAGAALSISGADPKTLTTAGTKGAGVLNLAGTTNWSGSGALNVGGFDGPALINNTGTLTAQPGVSMNGLACCQNPSQLNNSGTLVVPDLPGTVLISFVSYNPVVHGLQASGRATVGRRSTLELEGAPSTWGDGVSFSGAGRTLIDHLANTTLQGNVFLNAGHTLELGTDAFGRPGSISGHGTLNSNLGSGVFAWTAGTLLTSLSVANTVTTVVRGPAGKTLGEYGKPGSGALALAGPTFLSSALNFAGPAVVKNAGTFIMQPGASMNGLSCCPQFSNAGNLVNDSGSTPTAISNIQPVNSGAIQLTSGVLKLNYATFTEPAGATLQVTIAGPTPGTDFGQLQASRDAVVGGKLIVAKARGFVPVHGQTFKVITCAAACGGTFTSVSTGYGVQYHAQDVTLVFTG